MAVCHLSGYLSNFYYPHCFISSSMQNSTTDIPQPSYHRPLDGCGKAASVAKLLRLDNLTTLISQSSTGNTNYSIVITSRLCFHM